MLQIHSMNETSPKTIRPGSPDTEREQQIAHDTAVARERFAGSVLEIDSVLALFARRASSSLGRRMLERLVPRSAEDVAAALERLREMQLLDKAGDTLSLAGLCDPLPARGPGARTLDEDRMVALRGFLAALERLQDWFAEREEDVPQLAAELEAAPNLMPLRLKIDAVIDDRGRVRADASALLTRLRQRIRQLTEHVDGVLRALMNKPEIRAVLSDGSVHRRGGRPVLAVRAKSSGRVRGIVHDRSQSDHTVFVEPQDVIEAGNSLAEARSDQRRETERILIELTRAVLQDEDRIQAAAVRLGEIELASISARYCKEEGARPALLPGEVGAAKAMLLRESRHPLLIDQVASGQIDAVVPIDLRLGDEFRMMIITGPNTGGKTLALKTAGLFALMTRLGLPIPAEEGSTVPLYDGVAADIGDEQEISQNLSTFASHLVRIREALERATPQTLILLDELGGGTDPDEGAALGESVLEALLKRDVPTLVSTHISKLKEFAYRHEGVENACTEFDLRTLEPLYQLHVGTPGESGALIIAKRLGLPDDLVERAGKRLVRHDGELEALMEDVRQARVEAERARTAAEDKLAKAMQASRELDDVREQQQVRGDMLEREAQRGIEERVRNARRMVEKASGLVDQLPGKQAEDMRRCLNALDAELGGAALSDRRQEFLDSLQKGSMVYVPRYRQRLLVQKVDRAKGLVTVKLGGMKMRVALDEVTLYESL
ncbi:MAG: DNA mismatch repair protein MutS2 [Planctomycetota bacterium]|jgi:DNA mismatch repair protein MutS2